MIALACVAPKRTRGQADCRTASSFDQVDYSQKSDLDRWKGRTVNKVAFETKPSLDQLRHSKKAKVKRQESAWEAEFQRHRCSIKPELRTCQTLPRTRVWRIHGCSNTIVKQVVNLKNTCKPNLDMNGAWSAKLLKHHHPSSDVL